MVSSVNASARWPLVEGGAALAEQTRDRGRLVGPLATQREELIGECVGAGEAGVHQGEDERAP